jgi:hypothetical protein
MLYTSFSSSHFLKNSLTNFYNLGGANRTRTDHLLRAKQALYQMSYGPNLVGLDGLEPSTSPLSGVRSNHLSYRPAFLFFDAFDIARTPDTADKPRYVARVTKTPDLNNKQLE